MNANTFMSDIEIKSEAVQEQLRRILDSKSFASSARLSAFLKFVVEERLAGRADQIKEYSIGVSVYGKPSDYDPKADATVRGEASRLRSRLERYYALDGTSDSLRIEIPKGAYVPSIRSVIIEQPRHWRSRVAVAALALILGVGIVRYESTPSLETSEEGVSFSPDGTQIAFSWNGGAGTNVDIFVKKIGSGQTLRITSDAARDTSPAWSPDGRYVAFLREPGENASVLIVSPSGADERVLAHVSGRFLAWTSDGTRLAVVDRRSNQEPLSIRTIAVPF
jgi:hypothetical protein